MIVLKEKWLLLLGPVRRRALLTGHPFGNGKATAMVFAREGAAVMATDIRLDAAEETRRAIEAEGGTCSVFQADISRSEDCQAMAQECLNTYGHIDILHNNVEEFLEACVRCGAQEVWRRGTKDV